MIVSVSTEPGVTDTNPFVDTILKSGHTEPPVLSVCPSQDWACLWEQGDSQGPASVGVV